MTVLVSTPVPASSFAARLTAYGLMHTDAALYSTATWQPRASSASVSTGWSSEWSNILANSASVGADMATPGDRRQESGDRDSECGNRPSEATPCSSVSC